MSNKALTWAFEADIDTPGAKFVLVALADHASDHAGEDWTCWPGIERLMQFTSMPARTIERHMAWLESEGWITRATPRDHRGRKLTRRYTLHRERVAPGVGASLDESDPAVDSACPPANMAGGETLPSTRQNGGVHPPNPASPPAKMAGGYYIAEPPINPQEPPQSARASDDDGDGGGAPGGSGGESPLNAAVAAWARRAPERVSPNRAAAAWRAAVLRHGLRDGELLAAVQACVRRDPDFERNRALNLDRWLAEDRFLAWMTAAESADSPPPPARWDGPPEVRAAVAQRMGEAAAYSLIDPARWDERRRAILTRTRYAADRLGSDGRAVLNALDVIVEHGGAHGSA